MRDAERPRRNLRHTNLAEFVEQGAVADLEPLGRLLTVPAIFLEYFEDDLALKILGGLLGDVLEGDGFAEVDLGGDAAAWLLGHHLGDQGLLAADEDVAADEVLKLADVSRPVIALHEADGALGE